MAKSIDLWGSKKPVDATAINRSVDVNGRENRRIEKVRDRTYRTNVWFKLRLVMLKEWTVCLYCNTNEATMLDHYVPLSKDEARAHDPTNLVPCCKPCHDSDIRRYDVVGGKRGQTRSDKPDPRDGEFYARLQAMARAGRFDSVEKEKKKDLAKQQRAAYFKGEIGC